MAVTKEEAKLECLEWASYIVQITVDTDDVSPEKVIEIADVFYQYVIGVEK